MLSTPTERELSEKEQIEEKNTERQAVEGTLEKFYDKLSRKAKGEFWQGSELISGIDFHPRKRASVHIIDSGKGYAPYIKGHQNARNLAYLLMLYKKKGLLPAADAQKP